MTELDRITNALAEVVANPQKWLQTSNEVFDNRTPIEVINAGESEKIWNAIYILRSGSPT